MAATRSIFNCKSFLAPPHQASATSHHGLTKVTTPAVRRQASALTNDRFADSPYTSAGCSSLGGALGVSGRGVAIIAVVFAGDPCRREGREVTPKH